MRMSAVKHWQSEPTISEVVTWWKASIMMNSNGTIVFDVFTTENHVLESIAADPEHMSQFAYLLTAITLFFIGFFGFFLNLFVIILMCKDIQVSVTTSGIVLLSLSHFLVRDNRKWVKWWSGNLLFSFPLLCDTFIARNGNLCFL